MTDILDEVIAKLDGVVVEDPEHGVYRARRSMFTDPELFEPAASTGSKEESP
jgi:benzoate/toluate 1,2-dioxygenase subunit alpha